MVVVVVVEVVVMVVEVFVSAMLLTETLQNRQQNAMRWMYFQNSRTVIVCVRVSSLCA